MPKIPVQNYTQYNRESGRKTLLFMGILITTIVILTVISLLLITRPRVLTSSLDKKPVSTPVSTAK